MNVDMKNLYSLQEVDIRILQAKRAKAALDDGSAAKEQSARLEADLQQSTSKLRSLEAEMKDCELNLMSIETKKQNYQRKLYGGKETNPKELESMEKEIEMLSKNQGNLETRILELMDTVQEQSAAVSAVESHISEKKAELAAIVENFTKRSAELADQIAKSTAERDTFAKSVDERLLRRYENLRAHASGIAIGKVEDGKCGACHVALTPFSLSTLRESEEAPVCESCGRLLYLPE
ncbi:MAG: C4-type zinc ribbon domain-containing protein [Armatimonadota bacterium]|nr:C4-type zinc ribbon domain-containing protein [Armatimonadota bacterium]